MLPYTMVTFPGNWHLRFGIGYLYPAGDVYSHEVGVAVLLRRQDDEHQRALDKAEVTHGRWDSRLVSQENIPFYYGHAG